MGTHIIMVMHTKQEQLSLGEQFRAHRVPVAVVGVLTTLGLFILLPILFACTLPDAETLANTHAHQCTFYDLETTSMHRCCRKQETTCSGCLPPALSNGKCSATAALQKGLNVSLGMTRTYCCDGRCCAHSHTECQQCTRQSCTTDSDGHQSCTTELYECNCVEVCDRYSQSQSTIACGTCHAYRVGYYFTLDGVRHDREHKETCGLTGSGVDDIACQAKVAAAYVDNTTARCYVNHDTLEVSWDEPEWNVGCWVGIGIGSLLLCPVALIILAMPMGAIWLCIKRCKECHHHRQLVLADRALAQKAERLWEEECHAIDEQLRAMEEQRALGCTLHITFKAADNTEFEAVCNDNLEVALIVEQLPVITPSMANVRIGDVTMAPDARLCDFGVASGAMIHCSTDVDLALLEHMQRADGVVEVQPRVPRKPTLDEVRQRVENGHNAVSGIRVISRESVPHASKQYLKPVGTKPAGVAMELGLGEAVEAEVGRQARGALADMV